MRTSTRATLNSGQYGPCALPSGNVTPELHSHQTRKADGVDQRHGNDSR